jgi:hypothetical protein
VRRARFPVRCASASPPSAPLSVVRCSLRRRCAIGLGFVWLVYSLWCEHETLTDLVLTVSRLVSLLRSLPLTQNTHAHSHSLTLLFSTKTTQASHLKQGDKVVAAGHANLRSPALSLEHRVVLCLCLCLCLCLSRCPVYLCYSVLVACHGRASSSGQTGSLSGSAHRATLC